MPDTICLHGSDRLTVLCRAAASLYAPAARSARDLLGGGPGLRARLDMAADGTTLNTPMEPQRYESK